MSAPSIADSLRRVLGQVESAARRAGRSAGEVRVVVVSKTQPLAALEAAYAAGARQDPAEAYRAFRGRDPQVEALLRGGRDLPEALAATGRLPRAVIEAVAVGEATGTTAEALDRVADTLDQAAVRGFAAAVQAVGFLAWALVAGLVALVVIRVVATYARMIQDLTRSP
jgi:type II secretory pathway component PulF